MRCKTSSASWPQAVFGKLRPACLHSGFVGLRGSRARPPVAAVPTLGCARSAQMRSNALQWTL
eukprot:72859-Chlamydomonas_euryale.AAC.2